MKKSLILLAVVLLFALSAFGQKTDSALDNTFNFPSPDSVWGVEGKDFQAGEVLIFFDKQEINLIDFLKGIKKTDPILKGPLENNLLDSLGVDYSLIGFVKTANLAIVKTRPGQSVKEAIEDIKKSSKIKISIIQPNYFSHPLK